MRHYGLKIGDVARMLGKAMGLDRKGELVAVVEPEERRKLLDQGELDAMVVMAEQGNEAY
jgi:hypothetical protein